jgi:hypothetical protein
VTVAETDDDTKSQIIRAGLSQVAEGLLALLKISVYTFVQVLRVRISRSAGAIGSPRQYIAPVGDLDECLTIRQLGPEAAADTTVSTGVCRIVPGAVD